MNRNLFSFLLSALIALASLNVQAQSKGKMVDGSVIDEDGKPLAGVTVLVEGQPAYAITDADGHFRIAARNGDVLKFEMLGMLPQKTTIGEGNTVNVKMITDAVGLNEVVVIGYGVQNRRLLRVPSVIASPFHHCGPAPQSHWPTPRFV